MDGRVNNKGVKGNKGGYKGYGEHLQIIKNYSDLQGPFFEFLKDKMENGTDEEKWRAVQILKGAFEKMIPQDLTSGGEKLTVQLVQYGHNDPLCVATGKPPAPDTAE